MNIQQVMQPNRNSPQMKSVAPGQARWRWRGGGSLGDLSKNCQLKLGVGWWEGEKGDRNQTYGMS